MSFFDTKSDIKFDTKSDYPADFALLRHHKIAVKIGDITIGGGYPIVIQSMTNTDTADIEATLQQIIALYQAGSQLVRITVDREEAAQAVPYIIEKLHQNNLNIPIIGDFHYNGHLLLQKYPDCAQALAKYRINPGNVGFGVKKDKQFATIIELAIKYNKAVRIGVNWGSLDQALLTDLMNQNEKSGHILSDKEVIYETMVRSALQSAVFAEDLGLNKNKIILSAKVSQVPDLIAVYNILDKRSDYALHLGLTEAGMGSKGLIASSAALAILLYQGIGDTIRISLTPQPGGDRCKEVKAAQELLQSMGLTQFMPVVSACPGCGRTSSVFFQELAQQIEADIEQKMPIWRHQYPGVEKLKIAVMGCIVNGPGESKHADIGISLPGINESPVAPVFIEGKKFTTLRGDNIAQDFQALLQEYIAQRFGNIKTPYFE